MSTSITKSSNKRLFKNKSNYLIITPLFSNQATTNSTNKNTLIINSRNDNLNNYIKPEKSKISIFKIDNNNINFKLQNKINKNSPRRRNSPLNNITKNNKFKTNELLNNKNYNICIHRNIDLNNYNSKSKDIQNNIKRKNKNIYFLDKILSNKYSRSSRNISKLKYRQNFFSKETKNSKSKKKVKKEFQENNLVINNISKKKAKKNMNQLSGDNSKKRYRNKITSRNYFLKVSSSFKIKNANNININKKLITNSINSCKVDKNIYSKKKLNDSCKYLKIINKKYNMKNFCNNKSNHNILANLLLKDEKIIKNNNIRLYNIINKKCLKKLEISHKSSLFSKNSKMFSFNSNLNDIFSNKNNIPKPLNFKNNIIAGKEFNKKDLSPKLELNSQSIENIKSNKYKKYKDKHNNIKNNKDLHKINSFKNNLKGKCDEKYQNKNITNITKINLNRKKNDNNEKNLEEINNKKINSKTSDNSIILGKDSYFDYLIDTLTKSKNKKENIEKLINDIKINNYIIKKPNEDNMKFTLLKNKINENEESIPEINKSKIFIGDIEGYKDIIESDKNNYYKNEKENTINIFGQNTMDNINDESKTRNKKILLNLNSDDLEISNLNNINNFNNNYFINDSEIKTFLNCMSDEYEFEDLSTTILKKHKKTDNYLLPYHINKISFIKTFDERAKKYIIIENIDNNNKLLINNNKNKDNYRKNMKNKKKEKGKEKIDINDEFFIEKDLISKNKNYFSNNNNNIKKNIKSENNILLIDNLNKNNNKIIIL